jgi:O-antigen/teichoic acid export membrane protein
VNILLSPVLIPQFGALGAGYMTLAGDIAILIFVAILTRASINSRKLATALLRMSISLAGMALVLMLMQPFPVLISIPLGAAVYVLLLVLTGTLQPHEVQQAISQVPLPTRLRERIHNVVARIGAK